MLYRLSESNDGLGSPEPLEFQGVETLKKKEKALEDLIAGNLLDIFFEDEPLLPLHQEHQGQSVADIYALNRAGDLVIFELKRGVAGEDAMLQAIRYVQRAGRWTYRDLAKRYRGYKPKDPSLPDELRAAHREAFGLEAELEPAQFNERQHLYVVGNAANDDLIDAIEYWRRQGLSVEFLPYRIYDIGGKHYFEFSSVPYDRHTNPSPGRGVLFDTNYSYNKDSIWEMMEKKRVAAYGESSRFVTYLRTGDIVFFYHKSVGLVAAGEVLPGPVGKDQDGYERYRKVRLLTNPPDRTGDFSGAMSVSEVREITGRNFFWARTIKVPYLDLDDAQKLLDELRRHTGEPKFANG